MPDAIITATESTFGTISGTFSADQSTVTGTVTGVITGTLSGSVGVPGPAGPGVPAGGTAGQILQKIDGVDYNTDWVTVNFSATWGSITGTLSSQTDLQTALDGKYSTSNPAGYITSSALTGYATESWVTAGFYPLASNPAGYLTSASLSGYALLSGATFTGTLSAPTPSPGTDSTVVATTEWVKQLDYAPLNSPQFVGNPRGPTPSLSDDDTSLATTAFVKGQGYITSAALSPYLLSSTAASTYLTQSNAATTYALKTNGELKGNFTLDGTAASPNSDGSILIGSLSAGYSYLNLAAGGIEGRTFAGSESLFTLNGTSGLGLFSSGQGVRFPDASVQTVAYPGPSGFLLKADNLSGLASVSTARTNLGLGTMATATAADYSTTTVANGLYYPLASNPAGYLTSAPVTSVAGRTGAVTLAVADVSGAAPTASPALTGTPTAPTAAAATNTTQIATTEFVTTADNLKANLASPTFTGTPAAPTATAGTNTTQIATTAFVRADNNVKAWVNFNGTGTVAIRASYNVSSITDGGVGTYTVNLTNAISSNATGVGMVSDDGTAYRGINLQGGISNITTTSYKINTFNTGGGQVDPTVVQLVIFR